ncbi:MAG: SNF2 helicase associated domain-containing protein [Saprospiraceae bacterium]|nr:SNF2 helicase associated domain-containing protein [Saprospiraceae bacterium]
MNQSSRYEIVYSLSSPDVQGLMLPLAYIVEKDKNELPGYLRAQAKEENCLSYGIQIDGPHSLLLKLCEELTIESIEKNFNRNQKKPRSLSLLFEDAPLKKLLRTYVDTRMDKFLKLIRDNQIPICLDLQRKVRSQDVRLTFCDSETKPLLFFRRTQTGIHYSMQLQSGEKTYSPFGQSLLLVTDLPGWIISDNEISQLESINTNKLRPFLTKETVFINDKLTKEYFEKFIVELLGQAEVETEGFEVIKNNTITSASLKTTMDILTGKWVIEIYFFYDSARFNYADVSRKKTKLHISESGEITVIQHLRNEAEEENYVGRLLQEGFSKSNTKRFETQSNDSFDALHQIAKQKLLLEAAFSVEPINIDEKKITLASCNVIASVSLKNDWFDLNGSLLIDEVAYPLKSFFYNIRHNNPFYKLKDGTFVILPDYLMAQYGDIAAMGSESGDHWRLPKSNYTLLEQIEGIDLSKKMIVKNEEIEYQPSERLKATLRPYQIDGVKWLLSHYRNNLGACLADDMGLGKTLQVIALLTSVKDELKSNQISVQTGMQMDLFSETSHQSLSPLQTLIVLPSSLVFNWAEELRKFAPSLHVCRHVGPGRQKDKRVLGTYDIILTTYQTLLSDINLMSDMEFNYVVLDESQQIRNRNSQIFKAIHQLNTKNKISLSGTPIENSLADLWSQMQFINRDILGTYTYFNTNFQKPIEKGKSEIAVEKLKTIVQPFILRRTKEQVAPDLPELSEQIYYSEMTPEQTKRFEEEKSAARNFLMGIHKSDNKYRFHVFATLTKLRLIANHPVLSDAVYDGQSGKFNDVTFKLRELTQAGHKVLVFSSFKTHLRIYKNWLETENIRYVALTGDTLAEERRKAVSEFQNNADVSVFLITLKAGGTGLNLTAADYVFILDPWWNPFIEKQAVARAHRIGRANPVMVTRFISKASIEEKIMILQEKKKKLSDEIIEINEMPDWVGEDLGLIFE